jgi:hypothetical protein
MLCCRIQSDILSVKRQRGSQIFHQFSSVAVNLLEDDNTTVAARHELSVYGDLSVRCASNNVRERSNELLLSLGGKRDEGTLENALLFGNLVLRIRVDWDLGRVGLESGMGSEGGRRGLDGGEKTASLNKRSLETRVLKYRLAS